MHTRDERRFLTQKYVQRQTRLDKMYKGGYRDKFRRPADAIMMMLFGMDDATSVDHPTLGTCYSPPTARILGRWRNHSFTDCGVPRCPMCGNPRRLTTRSTYYRLTMQERKADESYRYQLLDYFEPDVAECDIET